MVFVMLRDHGPDGHCGGGGPGGRGTGLQGDCWRERGELGAPVSVLWSSAVPCHLCAAGTLGLVLQHLRGEAEYKLIWT